MMKTENSALRRSHEPVFWLLFGAGGMLAALIGAMLVFVLVWGRASGLLPEGALDYAAVRALAASLVGKAAILMVVALFFWHAVHRLFHSLHDFGINAGPLARLLVYGSAAVGTGLCAGALLAIGF